jgi:DNA-binding LytR/AlgR family response regulator
MIRIAVCDDQPTVTASIEKMLESISYSEALKMEIDIFFDGATLEKSIKQGNRYDLIYLDIEMEVKDGIVAAREIRSIDQKVLLIYISGYECYLKELFEVEPFRFISKPIDKKLFDEYFLLAYQRICERDTYFLFHFSKITQKIPQSDILYFESIGRVVLVHLKNGTEKFYGKLNDVEKVIQNGKGRFLRIHQSYLVNYNYIRKMVFSSVTLTDGTELQISGDRQKTIRTQFCKITGGEILDNG